MSPTLPGGVVPYERSFPGVGFVRVGMPRPSSRSTRAHHDPPSLGAIYFWAESPDLHFECLLGETSPTPKKGSRSYGGWETVKRKRRRSVVEFVGPEPLRLDIAIIMDGFAREESIEHAIDQLEKMAGRQRPGQPEEEPPLIQFNSAGVVPHDFHRDPSVEWVIEDIEWGDAERRQDGNRIRQAATVVLVEYVEDDTIAGLTSAQKNRLAKAKKSKKRGPAFKGANTKHYVVRNGDTLESIAAHELGSASRWHELKQLNPSVRDPTLPIPAGKILVMP